MEKKNNKTLIVYSSLSGCTQEVAEKISKIFEGTSISTDLIKINDKEEFKLLIKQDLTQYSSILFGTSIVAGKFNKNLRKFLSKLESMPTNDLKLGLFICCMKASEPERIIEATKEYIKPNLDEYNLSFSIFDSFGGKLDFSPTSTMNRMMMGILKKIMKKDNPDIDEIEDKVYDFRDWNQIEDFSASWLKVVANS